MLFTEKMGLAIVPNTTSTLSSYLEGIWERNKKHKQEKGIDQMLLDALCAYRGQYPAAKLSQLTAENMPVVYMGISGVKARAAISWLMELYSNERTWTLEPSPVPDLPIETLERISRQIQEDRAQQQLPLEEGGKPPEPVKPREILTKLIREARRTSETQATMLADQLEESGFRGEFQQFLWNVVTCKTAIMRGPVVVRTWQRFWNPETKALEYRQEEQTKFYNVSPLDAFPSPDDDNFLQDFVERVRFTRNTIADMKGVQGFIPEAIDRVLEKFPSYVSAAPTSTDTTRADQESKASAPTPAPDSLAVGRLFWVDVPGNVLREHGLLADVHGNVLKDNLTYPVEAIKIGDELIFVDLNRDPLSRKPYTKASWSPIPGSFWGESVLDLMSGLQDICNASVRSLVRNMSFSAGPQTVLNDIGRMAEGEVINSVYGGRVWQFTNRMNSTLPPVTFERVDSAAAELMSIYIQFAQLADDYTGIPAYTYGNDRVAGAGRTYSGLSVLMTNAAKGIKRVITELDQRVITELLSRLVDYNLTYNPAFIALGGDIRVQARGAVAIMAREALSERRMEFLRSTATDQDMQVLGIRGRALLLKEAAKSVEIPGEDLVPDIEEIEDQTKAAAAAQQAAQQQQQQAQQMMLQAQMQEMQAKLMETQAKIQMMQAEAQSKIGGLQLQAQEAQAGAQIKIAGLKVKSQELSLRSAEAQARAQSEEEKHMLKGADLELRRRQAEANHERAERQDNRDDETHQIEQAQKEEEYVANQTERANKTATDQRPEDREP
jgi:hypothetical protein